MEKVVTITCSPRGLESIFVDNEELDCGAIRGKDISDWFSPSHDRSGWRGLMTEICNMLCDETAEFQFLFFGPETYESQFKEYLDEHNISYAGAPTKENRAEILFIEAKKAEVRGNEKEAQRLFKEAAEMGHVQSRLKYADILIAGKSDVSYSNDYERATYRAFTIYHELTEQGVEDAIRRLADCYKTGIGTIQDISAAKELLQKLADTGDESALRELSEMLEKEKSEAPSADNLNRETEPEDAPQVTNTAEENPLTDSNGIGVMESESKAKAVRDNSSEDADPDPMVAKFMQLRSMAFAGDVTSQYLTGRYFLEGRGVNRDPVSAFYWFDKASKKGDKMAMFYLGSCYEFGWGVNADKKVAAHYYKLSKTEDGERALKRMKLASKDEPPMQKKSGFLQRIKGLK